MRTKDLLNWSKFYKTTSFTADGFPGPLKGGYICCGLHNLAEVVSGTTPIQDR